MVVVTNRIYLNSSALQNLATRNIQNVDLNYCPMVNGMMKACFYENQNIVNVTNFNEQLYNIEGVDDPWDSGCFTNCTNLTYVSNLNNIMLLNNVSFMFKNCTNLTDAPSLPSSLNRLSTRYMYRYCTNLVNVPDIVDIRFREGDYMFSGCHSLVNAPNFVNCQITDFGGMFEQCYNLVNAPVIPNMVTSMWGTFTDCINLTNAPEIPNSVTSLSSTFWGCSSLINAPDLSNLSGSVSLYGTFGDCYNLTNIPGLPNTPTSSITNIAQTFQGCSNLTSVPEFVNVTGDDMLQTFSGCSNLTSVPNIPSTIVNMQGTFRECTNLTGNIYIHSEIVNDVADCFYNTSLDKNVYIPFNSAGTPDETLYAWINKTDNQFYTKEDVYNICNGMTTMYPFNIYDNSGTLLGGGYYYGPTDKEFRKDFDDHGVINYDMVNNINIPGQPGGYSTTYNTFTNAGYGTDPTNRVDGVCLFDINA